ncbi:Alpha/Beta hydrolase protein [Immersiella caudata]|uniref:Alpha/Beta hydrolase protein n=1 Tax=Immersiella caudata TaxID=314043 RepID=A0AA39WW41_9PEZI|nr:Alpha/Beta hydrolase protein [Immersiella caudata]
MSRLVASSSSSHISTHPASVEAYIGKSQIELHPHPKRVNFLQWAHRTDVGQLKHHPSVDDAMTEYQTCAANDGCTIAFQTSQPLTQVAQDAPNQNQVIMLMHGFSGSSEYFVRNFESLSKRYWVVAPDMRGHGRSGRCEGGYHVSRLAMDLENLIAHLRRATGNESLQIVPVGCSIGAAVLWTHVELFGKSPNIAGFVFVDQAPLQDRSPLFGWDAANAHKGLYDEKTMLGAQKAWMESQHDAAIGLVGECLGYRNQPLDTDSVSAEDAKRDEEFFVAISDQCDGRWLARLIADHTRFDHREAIERIAVPCLVMAGQRSGCFSVEGMTETARRAREGDGMDEKVFVEVFESGHWLFYEQAERFNACLLKFADEAFQLAAT